MGGAQERHFILRNARKKRIVEKVSTTQCCLLRQQESSLGATTTLHTPGAPLHKSRAQPPNSCPHPCRQHGLKCCLYMATESPLLPEELWTPPGWLMVGAEEKTSLQSSHVVEKHEPSRREEWGSELCAFPRGLLSRERPNIGVERKSQRRNTPTLERLSLLHKCPDKKIKTQSASGKCSKTRKKTFMLKGQRKRRNDSISAAALDEHLRRQDEKEHH